MSDARKIANLLLEKKAVMLNLKEPFTFASGIRSPIYCDNRRMISYPQEREFIVKAFLKALREVNFDVVAGTATAGIPWASWLAARLKKPLAYIRAEKKAHGRGKQIEGADIMQKKVVIIEDLISTGSSSFAAVEACREMEAEVVMVAAIFTYEFERAAKLFEQGNCRVHALSNFTTLVKASQRLSILSPEELKAALQWNKEPEKWGPNNGFPNAEPKLQ